MITYDLKVLTYSFKVIVIYSLREISYNIKVNTSNLKVINRELANYMDSSHGETVSYNT